MNESYRKKTNKDDAVPAEQEFGEAKQTLFLQAMISHFGIYERCMPIIKVEYFNRILRPTAKYILDNLSRNITPIPEQIKAEGDREISLISTPMDQNSIELMLEDIERFCKYKEAESMLYEGVDLLRRHEFAGLEDRAKRVNLISISRQAGFSCRRDFSLLLRQSVDFGTISTGWETVDDLLFGGFQRNGLTIFGGQSGSGKSNCLINLALNWQAMGKVVVYVTLEMAERVINQRWAAMLTGMSTTEIRADLGMAELKIAAKLKHGYGDIFYIKMPEGETSTANIRAYLRELKARHGRSPDALICDYLDLLCPNKRMDLSNLFVKDKYVAEELRALAFEFDIAVATASQLNRGSYNDGSFDLSHTAGGMSKINTADDVIFIKCNPEMKQQGKLEFQFLKTRNSAGVGKALGMKYDPRCMRISCAEPEMEPISRNAVIGKLLKGKR